MALPVNRALAPWDRELSDPSWRKWFDMLPRNRAGRVNIGADAAGTARGMFPTSALTPHYTSGLDVSRGANTQQSLKTDASLPMPTRFGATKKFPAGRQGGIEYPYGSNTTMYGADEAIGRKSRDLALRGLEAATRGADEAADPFMLRQQRGNIQQHGTIEMPQDYARRTGRETIAETMDPASPLGQRDELEYGRRIGEADVRYGQPARIRGQAQLGAADIAGQARVGAAQIQGGAVRESARARERAAAREARADLFSSQFGYDLSPEEQDELEAILSELEAESSDRDIRLPGGF